MHWICTVLVLTLCGALGQRPVPDLARIVNVHILVTDGWGNQVPEAAVEFKPIGAWGNPIWIRYPKENRVTIPPGSYVISVNARGFRKYTEMSVFSAGNNFVPLSLAVADVETPEPDQMPSLTGSVAKAFLEKRPCWIRLVGISSGVVRNVEIEATGTFSIREILPGRYIVLIMNGGILKDSRIVEVHSNSHFITIH